MEWILNFPWDESGACAAEYSLLLMSIAVAIAGSVAIFGAAINGLYTSAVALFPV